MLTKFAEGDDVLHTIGHLTVGQAEDAAVEFDVLTAAKVALESGAYAGEQHASATCLDGAGIGPVDAGDQPQNGRFPGTVRSDDAEDLTSFHFEVDLVEGSEAAPPAVLAKSARHLFLEVGRRSTFDREVEGDVLELNYVHAFTSQMLDGFRLSPDKDDASQQEDDETHQHRTANPFELKQGCVTGHRRARHFDEDGHRVECKSLMIRLIDVTHAEEDPRQEETGAGEDADHVGRVPNVCASPRR